MLNNQFINKRRDVHKISSRSLNNIIYLFIFVCLPVNFPVWAGEPTYRQGIDIFVETGVDQPDRTPSWYASMVTKPYAPEFEILATRGTQGRYYPYTYAITVKDLVKFHGHDCEGLSHAAACCRIAFDVLFPDGIIDRSVLWGITGTSPCYSDVIAFLTGARLQYGNLGFFKDKKYGHAVILYREDTDVAVLATWKEGVNNIPNESVVLPEKISWTPQVSMREVMELKKVVKHADGKQKPYQVDLMRYYQWKHINDIFSHPLKESYQVKVIDNFKWEEWVDQSKKVSSPHIRTDTRLKNDAYRKKPVSME